MKLAGEDGVYQNNSKRRMIIDRDPNHDEGLHVGNIHLDAWLPELLEAKVAAHWRIPNSLKPAMSINKAQGQSLKIAGIDLEQPCFSHGQLLWPHVVEATILTGCFQNEEVFIPRIPLIHDDKHSPLHFKRLQFPIQVSFSMSINKAQGQSLKIAGIDLEQPCFSHGQLYVACSRVGSGRNKTSNFVYSSVLS
ncbi:hypothetical protein LAZ67_21000046 [Cordylochernes scorpioides]|uniref:ATP-dependent DNA helicase n=1 Tax=Cordylochernes scorpioides TaxID=51811 RepID=A0ABY6LQ89_9ARAC|nr:hypothetical protein LAZ67_21000046 [Cordylochernes scorpioides]